MMVLEFAAVMMTMENLWNAQKVWMYVTITLQVRISMTDKSDSISWILFLAQGPQEVTIRQCGARFPEQCITEDSGYFFVTLCSCDTDNCNKDLLCDCP